MLTLRTQIGLTQNSLAGQLGISRRAIGDWEAGNSYPKGEHLKQLLILAVEQHVFPVGHEMEEIRSFWKAAGQRILLDEAWLAALFPVQPAIPEPSQVPIPSQSRPRVDWGEALAVPDFYGRAWELDLLNKWVVEERCRVVSVLGLGGIGKSAIAITLMHQAADRFETVIWRSLRDRPVWEELLDDLLQVLAPQVLREGGPSKEQRVSILLEQLRGSRILLVLDNFESVLEEGDSSGVLRAEYAALGRFLRLSAETEHQSCLVLTSREKPADLMPFEGSHSKVRSFRLARLEVDACEALLKEKGLTASAAEQAQLIEAYTGNPLALKIVAQTIIDLFDGAITPFLEQGEMVFGGVRELLDEQYARLSPVERDVLLWLAISREPVTLSELRTLLAAPQPDRQVLEAIDGLHRRSLIERGQQPGCFTLQPVILDYATTVLIDEASREIREGQLHRLIQLGLVQAQAKDYIRQTQERLFVIPLLVHLRGQTDAQAQVIALLDNLRNLPEEAQGYGPANLLVLLRLLRGNLQSLDLSGLYLRGVYLQNIELQDTSLSGARVQDCTFTENFDAIWAVAINRSGQYWAAGTGRGDVRVWEVINQELHLVWQAHTNSIRVLMFHPNGDTLASGSLDGLIQIWNVPSGTLRWSGWHTTNVNSLAYSPDGSLLASAGNDTAVRLWDSRNGALLQTLSHPSPVFAVTWSTDGQLLASGDSKGDIRLWTVPPEQPAGCVKTYRGHTNAVRGLAFSPNSQRLASGSYDGTVKLWEVDDHVPPLTLTGHTDRVQTVVWSPDGHTLASSGLGPSIWLWDADGTHTRAVLHGHSAPVYGLAFTPDNRGLLSGSDDGTLRIWDIAHGQSVRMIQGYTPALYDLDWSPDGTQIVSGGANGEITLWDVLGGHPRVLRGHSWVVYGVGWSPDGTRIASSGWDRAIRLLNPITETWEKSPVSDAFFYGLTWSQDGQRVASGTYLQGIAVWDLTTNNFQWIGREFSTRFPRVAWRPDGAQIAAGGDDGRIYFFDPIHGSLIQKLEGHQGAVKCVAWHPNGTWLASGSSGETGGELFVWDVTRAAPIVNLEGHPKPVNAVAWGRTPEILISGGSDGKLRWWDIQHGVCLQVREAHQGAVLSLRRSPDGNRLASCGDDGLILLWDLSDGRLIQTFRRDRPYERLNITGIKGLTEAQKQPLFTLGAFEENLKSR